MWLKEKYRICRHSFRIRVFLALALIIFIFIPGTGYVGYLQARKVAEKQMQQHALGAAVQIAERVRSFLSLHTSNVKMIKKFLENGLIDAGDEKALLRYFSLLKEDHPEFVNIYYGSAEGEFLMAPPQVPEIHKIFDPRVRPWYRGARQSEEDHWTDVYLFASTQKPGITVSVPILDAKGKIRGVCGIDIDLSTFSQFLQGIRIGRQGYAYIFENAQGRVIAHPGLVQFPWSPGHIELLRACLANLKGEEKPFGLTTFKGEEYFTAYTDYPGKNWTVGVTLSSADFFESVQSIKQVTFSLVVIGILLASLLSYLLAMTVIRPLNALQRGIDRISSGDLTHKVQVRDPDIAEALAGSFNRMAASLGASREELRRTCEALAEKEKLAAVGQMTAGIAHEIKNPLGIILGAAQVVVNRERPWEMREKAARFIIAEVIRLDKTLKSFLAFAKPARPEFVQTDMLALLEGALSANEERYNEEGIVIERDYPEKLPLLLADADQVRQVIWNILFNAVQAMPEGGAIRVRVRRQSAPRTGGRLLAAAGDAGDRNPGLGDDRGHLSRGPFAAPEEFLSIAIRDDGCGIPEENMDRIMDPFVSFRDDGIGLGLSIVSQIVRLHRGHINIESQVGEGTTFCLLFPCTHQENR